MCRIYLIDFIFNIAKYSRDNAGSDGAAIKVIYAQLVIYDQLIGLSRKQCCWGTRLLEFFLQIRSESNSRQIDPHITVQSAG